MEQPSLTFAAFIAELRFLATLVSPSTADQYLFDEFERLLPQIPNDVTTKKDLCLWFANNTYKSKAEVDRLISFAIEYGFDPNSMSDN